MLNYIYYRAYCFYKNNGLAFEPHIWAIVIPTFITAFLIYLVYYIGVVQKIFHKVQGDIILFGITLLGLSFIMDKVYKDEFIFFQRKWDKEQGKTRFIKGILIAALAISSFFGLFILVAEMRKY